MPHEFDFLDWVRRQQVTSDAVPLAAGDDLAILRGEDVMLVGVDQVLDGVHFHLHQHDPRDIGRKAMNRNLSDCAAMACLPAAALVTFALPRGIGEATVKAIYDGIKSAGDAFDCPIVGGDTGAWAGPLAITVSIIGQAAGVTPVRRSGATPGDFVYVTGPLGGSILGRHLAFTPRVREARALVAAHRISAMIDLSDGLSRDLAHLCRESGVGAVIDAARVPVHPDVARLPPGPLSPLDHALSDGEDHELCFTSPDDIPGAIRIGRVVEERGLWIDQAGRRETLHATAFEHRF